MTSPQPESEPARPASGGVLDRALALVHFLRAHCPWDAKQTPLSLQRYLLEEAHEVAEAISADDPAALRDELGDLLLNLAFQVVIGEETGAFDREAVVAGLEQKMRRRHPHLYGDGPEESWAAIKARERADRPAATILGDLPPATDPLGRAFGLQDRVAGVGFDWPDWRGALDKVREETAEVAEALGGTDAAHVEEELGDLVFAVVNLVRLAGSHPVPALSRANAKFARRFNAIEALAAERGVEFGAASLEELDELWDEVKRRERAR
ncbi:MAG TPA: nucleoside triphosphate pyrophosphohydrolase [Longimicrobium sp.]|nr:nucleoside triphosphate pyrophosphohydrolase [Longimicrobium sp.]